jgi:hypothetical protein
MTSKDGTPMRVERGRPTAEELAVLTAVLLARRRPVARPPRIPVRWVTAYRSPHSWQTAA